MNFCNDDIIEAVSKINKNWNYYVNIYSKCTKTKEELCTLMLALKDKNIVHHIISNMLLKFDSHQLDEFISSYDKLTEPDKSDGNIQAYICILILYPEVNTIINFTDSYEVKKYNVDIIRNEYLSIETKIERIKLGKLVCYDSITLYYYLNCTESDREEYVKLADILINFKPLCYDSCCGRTQGTLVEYFKLLLTTPCDKRKQIAQYISNGKYSSLYIAKEICDYFSTLDLEEMEDRFTRAKTIWPDCYIDITHRFERLFVDLLKMKENPSEEEIIKIAKTDSTPRQDIDLCYFGPDDEIAELTKKRLNLL